MHQPSLREVQNSGLNTLEAALVSEFLSPNAQRQYSQGKIAKAELEPFAEAIKRISQRYTGGQQSQRLSPGEAAAYALYYAPINFTKVLRLLAETSLQQADPIRVLDFGCGPGTASLACLHYFEPRCRIDAFDHSKAMLEVAKRLFSGWPGEKQVQILDDFPDGERKYDLIIAANVLNELKSQAQKDLLDRLMSRVDDKGSLLLLDPALKDSTRNLMALRDWLLQTYADLVPRFPCTRRDACPMLAQDPEGWCHGALTWDAPQLVRQLDEVVGFNKHRIKYAGFVFQRGAELVPGVRAIEVPTKRGASNFILCGQAIYGPPDKGKAKRLSHYELVPGSATN